MERFQKASAEGRANTDASLDAERPPLDTMAEDLALSRSHRMADYLLERDRALADARLLQIRLHSDDLLAIERADTGRAWSRVTTRGVGFRTTEDKIVDDGKTAERSMTDALVEEERGLADAAIASGRQAHADDRTRIAANRHHTDDDLSAERTGADLTLAILGRTESALAVAQLEQDRRAEVLAWVTHDLQTPLMVITANAEHLELTTTDNTSREVAEEVTLAAGRMKRLLADLLDVVRIDSGVFHIVKRPQEARAFLAELLRQYLPLFAARGLELLVEVPSEPMPISLDHDRIVQVFSNLLTNAMKFTPRGGCVRLGTKREGERVVFSVRDNGPGMAPADLSHVFERFWQLDRKTRRGLGLGLNICEKIIAEHGGRIWMESTLGVGTNVQFSLPAGNAPLA
jgi:signal transduction histidine kinase